MKRKHYVIILCVVLACFFFALVMQVQKPLSTVEAQLVGNWKNIDLSSGEVYSECSFTSNRRFRSDEAGLVGRWWIEKGVLHLQTWGKEDSIWSQIKAETKRRRPIDTSEISFSAGGESVELSLPGAPPSTELRRLNR